VLVHEHAAGRRLGLGGAVLSAGRGGFRRWHDEVVMGGAVAVGPLYSNRLEHRISCTSRRTVFFASKCICSAIK